MERESRVIVEINRSCTGKWGTRECEIDSQFNMKGGGGNERE